MKAPAAQQMIQNRTFDEIQVGDFAQLVRTLRPEDIHLFAAMSGDVNPTHVDLEYARSSQFREVVGHSMWGSTLISTVLGTEFPGPGTVYVSQGLNFWRPITIGDTLTITVTCKEKFEHNHHIIFDCLAVNQDGLKVIDGIAEVMAPTEKISRARVVLPEVTVSDRELRYRHLLSVSAGLSPIPIAVAHPCDRESLLGPVQAARAGLVEPILVGPESRIRAVAEEHEIDIKGLRIVDTEHSHASAEVAVALCRDGGAEALMKGSLHTDELMSAVVHREHGLRGDTRISHAFLFDLPRYPKLIALADCVVNIAPDLKTKRDILGNGVRLLQALGIAQPKVGIVAAVETVNPAVPATLDAQALVEMARQGDWPGAIVEGPFGFDNAISAEAARIKKIESQVAGDADLLLMPDLNAGNMLYKSFNYIGGGDCAGLVLGARVPVVLTSRADSLRSRLASVALAVLAQPAP